MLRHGDYKKDQFGSSTEVAIQVLPRQARWKVAKSLGSLTGIILMFLFLAACATPQSTSPPPTLVPIPTSAPVIETVPTLLPTSAIITNKLEVIVDPQGLQKSCLTRRRLGRVDTFLAG